MKDRTETILIWVFAIGFVVGLFLLIFIVPDYLQKQNYPDCETDYDCMGFCKGWCIERADIVNKEPTEFLPSCNLNLFGDVCGCSCHYEEIEWIPYEEGLI